jgi:hypothetical protein
MNLYEGASTSIQQAFQNLATNSMYSSEDDTSSVDLGQDYKYNVPKTVKIRHSLPNFAIECDRHRISDISASAIASAVLQDLGVITENEGSFFIFFKFKSKFNSPGKRKDSNSIAKFH